MLTATALTSPQVYNVRGGGTRKSPHSSYEILEHFHIPVLLCSLTEELRCAGVACSTPEPPDCPADSVLSKSYTPPTGCCPTVPPVCTCDFGACLKPECPSGQQLALLREAAGEPGDCCSVYECQRGKDLGAWCVIVPDCSEPSISLVVKAPSCPITKERRAYILTGPAFLHKMSATDC